LPVLDFGHDEQDKKKGIGSILFILAKTSNDVLNILDKTSVVV
jgi:hypothetical protein